jgi:hypothetical protein
MHNLPTFLITQIQGVSCRGVFVPSRLIGDGWPACLVVGETRLVWGEFRDVDVALRTATFQIRELSELRYLEVGRAYTYLDSYWGVRAQLVMNASHVWHLVEFAPRDAVESPGKGGADSTPAALVPGGWDHEHCEICGEKIGRAGQEDGYVNETDLWVCRRCYDQFVSRRSLEFIDEF